MREGILGIYTRRSCWVYTPVGHAGYCTPRVACWVLYTPCSMLGIHYPEVMLGIHYPEIMLGILHPGYMLGILHPGYMQGIHPLGTPLSVIAGSVRHLSGVSDRGVCAEASGLRRGETRG